MPGFRARAGRMRSAETTGLGFTLNHSDLLAEFFDQIRLWRGQTLLYVCYLLRYFD
jgi:hypothetical protein